MVKILRYLVARQLIEVVTGMPGFSSLWIFGCKEMWYLSSKLGIILPTFEPK